VRPIYVGVVELRAHRPDCLGESAHEIGHRKVEVLEGPADDLTVRSDELDERRRLVESAGDGEEGLAAAGRDLGETGRVEHLHRALLKRLVDLAAQLAADDEEHEDRGKHHGEGHGTGGSDGDSGAKAHADSRRAYPTPRTVWIRRRLPPASVLRRR
jgi:hypothetical protein